MKLRNDCPKLIICFLNSRKFFLIALLVIFLIYCAYTSSTCVSNKTLLRRILVTPSEKQQLPSNIEDAGEEYFIPPNDTSTPHRTRTCANELSHYSATIRYRSGPGNRRLPRALIIGVKKSGTRALLEFLRIHPDVRASGCELHFFDRHYSKGLRWYRRHMPVTRSFQIAIEKTPSYFITREVPKRVFNMNPKTKLLLVVRDPVTRVVSDYTQAITKMMTARRFEDLAFVNGTKGSSVNTKWGPLRIGLYCRHLSRWLQYFPLSQFLFISGERLISDPSLELQRVEEFLKLKPVITEKDFYFNHTKGFPCVLRKSRPHCLGKTKGRSHPIIEPEAVERLRRFYRPFNRRFYEMTGMDFNWP